VFMSLGLETGNYCLLIWASKSSRRFLDLYLKTKHATVYQLFHKIDGRIKTTWDTRGDVATCIAWKQIRLVFPSLASRLAEACRGWCTWHHRGGCIELKLMMNESM
jgi:hypothetical protein